ncbi:MAG TPA: glucose 1-dehydrogenase [Acidimicrobiia bacterium]|nr:glucose 1-dehydrogenase [Acidimicrobiia bacterium]
MSIEGRAALVTGGGSGIGLGTAKRLAADGASVMICGRTEERLLAATSELREVAAPGVVVGYVVADVTKEDDVARAVQAASETTGSLDILFACAGGSLHLGPIVLSDVEAFRATLDLNITGTFLAIKHAAPVMARGNGGSIIGMSSIAGVATHKYMSAYCVGKAGIEMLVKVAADELGPSNIRVNAVQPGLVDTELVGFITAGGALYDDYLQQMPISRVGTVDDIANAVRYLAGPESSWVTGQMIGVDGGHQLRRGPNYGLLVEEMYGADACRGLIEQ